MKEAEIIWSRDSLALALTTPKTPQFKKHYFILRTSAVVKIG